MILDGYWKNELIKLIKQLKKWQNRSRLFHDYSEHQVSKAVLYSAVIIRKIFEDEKGIEKDIKHSQFMMPEFKILKYKLEVVESPFSGDKDFVIHRIIPENYDSSKAKTQLIALNDICNQIIHCYVWSVYYSSIADDKIRGVIFASDYAKETKSYALSLEEWIKAVEYCIENGNI